MLSKTQLLLLFGVFCFSFPYFALSSELLKKEHVEDKWMSFAEAQIFMQEQEVTTEPEFRKWKKAGNRPPNFPSHPDRKYKEEWVSWPHFFGTEKCKKAFK